MQVETYEVAESGADGKIENNDEAVGLIERLNLAGQMELITGPEKQVFPYRKMTRAECNVYGALCPRKTEISEYKDGMIPLRVLQVAAYVKETGFIDSLVVWHPESADVKDPILVGLKGGNVYWPNEIYLLARWGEVLEPFSELKKMAAERLVPIIRNQVQTAIGEAQADLNKIDSFVERLVNGDADTASICYSGIR